MNVTTKERRRKKNDDLPTCIKQKVSQGHKLHQRVASVLSPLPAARGGQELITRDTEQGQHPGHHCLS